MPTKPRNFREGFYYHVYNRGVEKRIVFTNRIDYQRFLATLVYYRIDQTLPFAMYERLRPSVKILYDHSNQSNPSGLQERVRMVAYCLMPNHFHLLLKPIKATGITQFLSDIQNSYTKYFNKKNDRTGVLFQGTFKAKEISSDASMLQVSRYIHLNPLLSSKANPKGLLKGTQGYPYSSYGEWVGLTNPKIANAEEVKNWLGVAGGSQNYKEFVEAKLGKDLASQIGDLTLEQLQP